MTAELQTELQTEFQNELHEIASWWIKNTVDELNGGFIGEMTVDNQIVANANKGIILNTRILWFFSEASIFSKNHLKDSKRAAIYQNHALRAFNYIIDHFLDSQHGGVYWELNTRGEVVNDRKQIYAQAFAIYGLSSYYKLSGDKSALNLAYKIFELIESNALDNTNEGYLEAFSGNWGELEDFRLSKKDLNSPKSMNTHLHILEAYTNLYAAGQHSQVADAIRRCLHYFDKYIINHETMHLRMFQSMTWEDMSTSISYGHDVECSWLMWEALEVLGDEALMSQYKPVVFQLADTCLQQAMGSHHEVFDAYNFVNNTTIEERVWWVQAEALVGFLNAFHISGESKFRDAAEKVWGFIKKYQRDVEGGEWHWLSSLDAPHKGDCKMGFWKAPYHNGRAMMEASKLLSKLAHSDVEQALAER